VDTSKLTLSLTGGGVVYQPLTRVRQGLFRFAVAALPRDLGNALTVDVAYSGVSLGTRTLPVGWDVWSANDPSVAAVGACNVGHGHRAGAGRTAPRADLALVVAAVAGVIARRRRRGGPRKQQA
jgi:hypothetical protein